MEISRSSFLKGLFSAFGTCACGGRMFAAPPGWKPPRNPNAVFGVISDTHLRTRNVGTKPGANWPDKYLVAALKHFREQNVDAVVHCGDMAHRGQVEEMQFHANAWNRVFPRNRAPDGHEVVKLFVTGNHDVEGGTYGDFVAKRYPDPAERARHVLNTDMAANWERIWGERYEPLWHREVKGYHFFGQHYGVPDADAIAYLRKLGGELALDKGDRPFFFMRHRRPYGDMRKKALGPLRNAVAFFGHNHWSAANWNMVYLYYNSLPMIEVPSCEPRGCSALVGDDYIAKAKLEGREAAGKGRQGYVVRLYDDMLVVERREFGGGGSLGSDWIMPLGKRSPHPFSRSEMKARIGEPQFRAGAKPALAEAAMPPPPDRPEKTGDPALRIDIPLADANPATRVYAYDVAVVGDGEKLFKSVYAVGTNLAAGHEPNGGVTTLFIPRAELPKGGRLKVAVRPITSLGTAGSPIVCQYDGNARKQVG